MCEIHLNMWHPSMFCMAYFGSRNLYVLCMKSIIHVASYCVLHDLFWFKKSLCIMYEIHYTCGILVCSA